MSKLHEFKKVDGLTLKRKLRPGKKTYYEAWHNGRALVGGCDMGLVLDEAKNMVETTPPDESFPDRLARLKREVQQENDAAKEKAELAKLYESRPCE